MTVDNVLSLLFTGGVGGVELTQTDSVLVKPGESFSISCKISVSSYCIHWIRQPAGKALEWLGYLCSGDSTNLKDMMKSKISLSQDKSSSTVYLRGQNFQVEDTAVYYCARDTTLQTHWSPVQKHPWSFSSLCSTHVPRGVWYIWASRAKTLL